MKKIRNALILAMALSMSLSACTQAPAESSVDSSSETSSTEGSSAGSEDTGIFTESGYPVVKEGENLTIDVFARYRVGVTDYNASVNKTTEWFEEKTGLTLEWQAVPDSDRVTKLNLMIQSNEYTDVILDSYFTPSEQYLYGQQGILVSISDMMEQGYAPNLEQAYTDYGDTYVKSMTMPDGKMYAAPIFGLPPVNLTSEKMWINQVWLDNLDLEVPQTTEELVDVLTAFKEQDANGNGDTSDEIPFIGSTNGWNVDPKAFIINSFIPYNKGSGKYMYVDDSGKLVYSRTTEEFKEALMYMNSLVEQGLLDELTFSQDYDALKQVTNRPGDNIVGMVGGGYLATPFNTGEEDARWHDYVAVPPLEGPDGVRYAATGRLPTESVFNITSACEYPEQVMRAFDAMYTEEAYMWVVFGEEGKDWVEAEDGMVNVYGDPAKTTVLTQGADRDNRTWNQLGSFLRPIGFDTWESVAVAEGQRDIQAELNLANQEFYEPYMMPEEMLLPVLPFEESVAKEVTQYEVAINDYADSQIAAFIVGTLDIEENWDAFISQLNTLGVERYIELYQAAYDIYAGA